VVALGQKADDIVVGEQVVRHVPAARVQRRWTCSALTAGAAARRRCGGQQRGGQPRFGWASRVASAPRSDDTILYIGLDYLVL
jgi:hypothetical protein